MIVALPWISLKFELSILTFDKPWKNDMDGASPLGTTSYSWFTEGVLSEKQCAFVEIGKLRLFPPPLSLLCASSFPRFTTSEGGSEGGGTSEGVSVEEEDGILDVDEKVL
jgi:hypothetical protein